MSPPTLREALAALADRWFQTGRNDFVLCAQDLRAALAAPEERTQDKDGER